MKMYNLVLIGLALSFLVIAGCDQFEPLNKIGGSAKNLKSGNLEIAGKASNLNQEEPSVWYHTKYFTLTTWDNQEILIEYEYLGDADEPIIIDVTNVNEGNNVFVEGYLYKNNNKFIIKATKVSLLEV